MKFFTFFAIFLYFCLPLYAKTEVSDELVNALIQVESSGNDDAVGDKGKAFGCLQIWQVYVDDVKDVLGMPNLTARDCLGDRELSIKIFKAYMDRYATIDRLGRKATEEDIARIHNGGPNGWKNESTKKYWQKVQIELESQRTRIALTSDVGAVFFFQGLFLALFFVSFYVTARVVLWLNPPVGGS